MRYLQEGVDQAENRPVEQLTCGERIQHHLHHDSTGERLGGRDGVLEETGEAETEAHEEHGEEDEESHQVDDDVGQHDGEWPE